MRIALLAAGLAATAASQEFLRPVNETFVKSGPVSIVAKGAGELRLDGKAVKTEHPAAGVVTATVTPTPGVHVLSLGSATIRFRYGAGDPAWAEFKPHPPAATCDLCHEVKAGAWEIKGGAAGENCMNCHDAEAFAKTHKHTSDLLVDCQLCHLPHGSAVKSHLRMAKEKACKQCHD